MDYYIVGYIEVVDYTVVVDYIEIDYYIVVVDFIFDSYQLFLADINSDQEINVLDIVTLVNLILS